MEEAGAAQPCDERLRAGVDGDDDAIALAILCELGYLPQPQGSEDESGKPEGR